MKYSLAENNISCNVADLSIIFFVKSSKLKHEYYYLQDKYTNLTFKRAEELLCLHQHQWHQHLRMGFSTLKDILGNIIMIIYHYQ